MPGRKRGAASGCAPVCVRALCQALLGASLALPDFLSQPLAGSSLSLPFPLEFLLRSTCLAGPRPACEAPREGAGWGSKESIKESQPRCLCSPRKWAHTGSEARCQLPGLALRDGKEVQAERRAGDWARSAQRFHPARPMGRDVVPRGSALPVDFLSSGMSGAGKPGRLHGSHREPSSAPRSIGLQLSSPTSGRAQLFCLLPGGLSSCPPCSDPY